MKTTSGELFTRKTQKHGTVYCLRYQVDGKRFKITLKDPDGNRITNKRDAAAAADKVLAPIRARDEVDRRLAVASACRDALEVALELDEVNRERLALSDAWARFEANPERPQCSDVMLSDYERRWRKFTDWLEAEYGDLRNVEDVTRTHGRAFTRSLDTGDLSANRRNKIIQGCRLVFSVLSDDCSGMENPFRGIKNRPLTTKNHRELSEAELMKACQTADGELRALLAIGLYTALRLGDAALLRWEDVRLARDVITVQPRKTRRTGKSLVIPLHPVLRTILEETPPSDRAGHVVPGLAERYMRDVASVCKLLKRHFESCGIETQERHPDQQQATCRVGFHSLRHSFVSLCAARGVPLAVVQELCGHGSPAIQRHYIHLGPDATAAAMRALPSITGGTDAEPTAKARLLSIIEKMSDSQVADLVKIAEKMQGQ